MKPEDNRSLISYRIDRSRESIKASKIMLENDMPSFAMNRIYYSMFYAVQALLVLRGVSFSKHGQIKGYFNREFIKNSILPVDMGRLYNKVFEYRQKFDYVDFAVPDRAMVEEYIERAERFHSIILEHIQSQDV